MIHVIEFFIWTFILYWIHRIAHRSKWLMQFHGDHHRYALKHCIKWHWSNFFLFTDTKKSSIDLWLTEVIPTMIFSYVTGAWWIFLFYYIWAAFVQEILEHNQNVNIPFWSSGQWHMKHHYNPNVNFGLFFTFWDILFGTNLKK